MLAPACAPLVARTNEDRKRSSTAGGSRRGGGGAGAARHTKNTLRSTLIQRGMQESHWFDRILPS